MHRTLDLNYFCDGHYDILAMTGGQIAWSDGQNGGVDNVQDITNTYVHTCYRNDVLRWTDTFSFTKTGLHGMWGDGVQYILFYADVEYDLFVMEKVVTVIDEDSCNFGPGYPCTGIQTHYGIVIFQGVEHVIWVYVIPIDTMPTIWNFWPWILDGNNPEMPETPPYSVDTDYNGPFWHDTHWSAWLGTLVNYTSSVGMGYPGPLFSTDSIACNQIVNTQEMSLPDNFLRVCIDKEKDSFSVKFKCYMRSSGDKVLTYPNVIDTLYRFNGGAVHYNNPTVEVTIELDKLETEEGGD